jgi:hypothetical protein
MKVTQLSSFTRISYLLCIVGLLLNSPSCAAMSWMYDAQVLDKDGVPCFTVKESHRKDAPELASIGVLDISRKGNGEMWRQFSIELDRVPFIFSPSVCLLYGTSFENTGDFSKPTPLEVGKPYKVGITADVPKGKGSETRRYQAHFCLSLTENGDTKVHQIFYNQGWHYDVCTSPVKINPPPVPKTSHDQ